MSKTRNNHGSYKNLLDQSICYENPIKAGNFTLGCLKIEFKFNKNLPKKAWNKVTIGFPISLAELRFFHREFQDECDLYRKLEKQYGEKIINFRNLLQIFYPGYAEKNFRFRYFEMYSEEIFDLIKKEGLGAFRVFEIRVLLYHWLKDNATAYEKIKMLESSLMEYSYGGSHKDKLFKVGRRPIKIIDAYGRTWLSIMYHGITKILKGAKERLYNNGNESIRDLIKEGFRNYIFAIEKKVNKKPKLEGYLRMLKGGFSEFEKMGPQDPISECIKNDKVLRATFKEGKWQPNKFARALLSKLLNVSESTIEAILFRKKTAFKT